MEVLLLLYGCTAQSVSLHWLCFLYDAKLLQQIAVLFFYESQLQNYEPPNVAVVAVNPLQPSSVHHCKMHGWCLSGADDQLFGGALY